MNQRWLLALLLLITLLGSVFRFYQLGEKGLWSDEIATIATSTGHSIDPDAYRMRGERFDLNGPQTAGWYREKAFQAVDPWQPQVTSQVLRYNVHPPMFFWLTGAWIHRFGSSPEALRFLPVIFGIFSIPAMFWVGRLLGGTSLGLLSAVFMAFSAYQVSHAQDARQYTLLILLALLAMGFTLKVLDKNRLRDWLALALCLILGLYTQYFFISFVGVIGLLLLWKGRGLPGFGGRLMGLLALLVLLFLPWLPAFQQQMAFMKTVGHYSQGLWKPLQLPEKLWRILAEFWLPGSPWGKIIPALIATLAAAFAWKNRGKKVGLPALALSVSLLWLMGILGGQIVVDVIRQSHTATIRRYLLLASPAYYLVLSGLLLSIPVTKLRAASVGVVICFLLGGTGQMLVWKHHSSDEFKQAAAWLNERVEPSELVLVNKSGAMVSGMAYYLHPQTRLWGLDLRSGDEFRASSEMASHLQQALSGQRRFWMVYSHAAPSTQQVLGKWFVQQRFQLSHRQHFPGVDVLEYQKP